MSDKTKSVITAVIIPAAGSGARMKTTLPKQFLRLEGETILARTAKIFLQMSSIHYVVIVAAAEYRQETEKLFAGLLPPELNRKLIFTNGGATRQDSVHAGLKSLPAEVEIVLVHDGARPMITPEIITRCRRGALEFGAAIAGIQVKDTLKMLLADGVINRTIDRDQLWHAQTPQGAKKNLLEQAFHQANRDNFTGTDEASLLEHAGIKVHIVAGSEQNIKITKPDDLKLIAGLLKRTIPMKIGHGYDAHQLVKNRKLILGGVTIPFELGLQGHSDADVLTHALIDAILGALGQGDIGSHFPDNDQKFKDISSLKLLAQTILLAQDRRRQIGNADITIICQQPRLAPFLQEMRQNLARTCKIELESINLKATTTEKMGFCGRGEGISAHAVVLLR